MQPDILRRHLTRQVTTFLAVGGAGYIADVVAFNVLRSIHPWSTLDPAVARTAAVAIAMCVTYLGNRTLTWHSQATGDRKREIGLFIVANVIGFGLSVMTLAISHDVMGLTSGLADNISANGVCLALGTVFRFIAYNTSSSAAPTRAGRKRRSVRGPRNRGCPTQSGQSLCSHLDGVRRRRGNVSAREAVAGLLVPVALQARAMRRVGT
jgi:putative flippase GtrA